MTYGAVAYAGCAYASLEFYGAAAVLPALTGTIADTHGTATLTISAHGRAVLTDTPAGSQVLDTEPI